MKYYYHYHVTRHTKESSITHYDGLLVHHKQVESASDYTAMKRVMAKYFSQYADEGESEVLAQELVIQSLTPQGNHGVTINALLTYSTLLLVAAYLLIK